jgi:hypothetical protein
LLASAGGALSSRGENHEHCTYLRREIRGRHHNANDHGQPRSGFDAARGVRLAEWAYRSRQKSEPPEIVEARFEQAGVILASYDADALAAATTATGNGKPEDPK